LKKGVSKNLILLNLFFALLVLLPQPLSLLLPFSFYPSLCIAYHVALPLLFLFFALLVFFDFLVSLSYNPFISFLLSIMPILLPHTHIFLFFSFILSFHTLPSSLLSLACPTAQSHNLPLSFFLPLYPITTHTFFPFYLILPCLSSQAHTHILSPSLCPFFFMLPHTHPSSLFIDTNKVEKNT